LSSFKLGKNIKKNKMKRTFLLLLVLVVARLSSHTYYVAVNGSDSNCGTISSPLATLSKAQKLVMAGDTVYIRGGVYRLHTNNIMYNVRNYAAVFYLDKSGKDAAHRICYFGYPGERPVFDASDVKPRGMRVSVFYMAGSYLHLRNFEVIGTQVTIHEHTQSENISARGGSNNIYENLAMHDGMGIGFYLMEGANNLILNCDAYNNYDSFSEDGRGGNADGFGGHPQAGGTGNIFRGCRAWYNSDDGFDLIRAQESVTIDHCWAFVNGYKPETKVHAADGNGIKGGGYGMQVIHSVPEVIPRHIISGCLAFDNEANGFYSNHHLGGNDWIGNLSIHNGSNYKMVNRKSEAECIDVPGYGHYLKGNISFNPRGRNADYTMVDSTKCQMMDNKIIREPGNGYSHIYLKVLTAPRKSDGSLPDLPVKW
jgi:hypothetical protein